MGKDPWLATQKLAKYFSGGEGFVYKVKAGAVIQACINGNLCKSWI